MKTVIEFYHLIQCSLISIISWYIFDHYPPLSTIHHFYLFYLKEFELYILINYYSYFLGLHNSSRSIRCHQSYCDFNFYLHDHQNGKFFH